MGWFEEWQQNNRKRFPNAALFFDAFREANEQVRANFIKGAQDGAIASVTGNLILTKKIPTPFTIALDALLGAGFAAAQDGVSAAIALTRSARETNPPINVNKPRVFYNAIASSLGRDLLQEVGQSEAQFEKNLLRVLEGEKGFSLQTIHALDKAVINLPADTLMASLDEKLSQIKITPDQKQQYLKSLARVLQKKIGLVNQNDKAELSEEELVQLGFVEQLIDEEWGLGRRLDELGGALRNINGYFEQAAKASFKEDQIHREMVKHKAISDGFQFLKNLGEITHSPVLQKVAVVGEASHKIISEVSKMSSLLSVGALGLSTFVSSISVIGAAGGVIMSLFRRHNQNDDSSVIIIKQLKELSQQMMAFRDEMHEQFKQTHHNQRLIYETVCQGFDLIYFSINAEMASLRYAVISKLEDIQGHLTFLESRIGANFKALNTQSLLKTISSIDRRYLDYEKYGTIRLAEEDLHQFMDELGFWIIGSKTSQAQCKAGILTGENILPLRNVDFQQNDYKRIINLLFGEDVQLFSHSLGFFIAYTERLLMHDEQYTDLLVSFRAPINVEIWSYTVSAYIKLRIMAFYAGFSYDKDESELKIILQDAEHALHIFLTIRKLSSVIFGELIKHYNRSIQLLQQRLKQETTILLERDLLQLSVADTRLPIEKSNVVMQGEIQLSLNGATTENLNIPAILIMAYRLQLGTFVFEGNRSERTAGTYPYRHSHHNLGVSSVNPSANYIVDVYFQPNDVKWNRIRVASGKKCVSGVPHNSNPGDRHKKHISDQNYQQACTSYHTWANKPLVDFLRDMWNGGQDLVFELVHEINERNARQQIEEAVFKKYSGLILEKDSVIDAYVQLNFFYYLIIAYKRIIGEKADRLFSLPPSGKDIKILLSSGKIPSMNALEECLISEILSEGDGDSLDCPYSELAYPIMEKIAELSSLFGLGNDSTLSSDSSSSSENSSYNALQTQGLFKRKRDDTSDTEAEVSAKVRNLTESPS